MNYKNKINWKGVRKPLQDVSSTGNITTGLKQSGI
jgi:hypothetical protein